MNRPDFAWHRSATLLACVAALAGCAGAAPRSREAQADESACRAQVDRAYDRQNRADFFRENQRDAPFAASGAPSVTSAGLGQRFGRDRDLQSCVRGSAAASTAGTGGPVDAPAAPTVTQVTPGSRP